MHMQSSHLLSPDPAAPFPNLIYKDVTQKVLSSRSPKWSSWTISSYTVYEDTIRHACSWSSFNSLFANLNGCIEGLDLHSLAFS
jgi:hypothetical protein